MKKKFQSEQGLNEMLMQVILLMALKITSCKTRHDLASS
jgi:hypothetical protein